MGPITTYEQLQGVLDGAVSRYDESSPPSLEATAQQISIAPELLVRLGQDISAQALTAALDVHDDVDQSELISALLVATARSAFVLGCLVERHRQTEHRGTVL